MARIRTIKPELWTDPEFVSCSPHARLLFIAGLNFATDYGVLADKPVQLKMQCFPGDSIDIDALIEELIRERLWLRETAPDGSKVIVIRTFNSHQVVNRPTPGRWGNPAEWDGAERSESESNDTQKQGRSGDTHGDLSESTRSALAGRERKGSNTCSSAGADGQRDPDFDRFWSAYPRKVGKKKAVTAWQRALKDADAKAITEGAQRYEANCRARDLEDQYIAHPTTWLNRGGWDDELPEPNRARQTQPQEQVIY